MTERHEEAIALQHHPNAHVSDGVIRYRLLRAEICSMSALPQKRQAVIKIRSVAMGQSTKSLRDIPLRAGLVCTHGNLGGDRR
jgi:hypothetical protein